MMTSPAEEQVENGRRTDVDDDGVFYCESVAVAALYHPQTILA